METFLIIIVCIVFLYLIIGFELAVKAYREDRKEHYDYMPEHMYVLYLFMWLPWMIKTAIDRHRVQGRL